MRWIIVAVLASACSSASLPPPSSKGGEAVGVDFDGQARRLAVETDPRSRVAFDLDLRSAASAPPTWRELPTQDFAGRDLATGPPTLGARHALERTTHGAFLTSNRGPILGPLPLPDATVWTGFDERDRLYVATRRGILLRVERAEDAIDRASYRPIGEVPGAEQWDAAGRFVVAGRGASKDEHLLVPITARRALIELWVSEDHGAHFVKRELPGEAAADVFVRADGFIAASIGETMLSDETVQVDGEALETFVSGDVGRSWRKLERSPRSLGRVGGTIFGYDDQGSFVITASGALSEGAPPCAARWSERLFLGEQATPQPEACFEIDAHAPVSGAAIDRREEGCNCPSHNQGCIPRFVRWWRDGYMRGDSRFEVPKTRTYFGLFDASMCTTSDRYVEPPPGAPTGGFDFKSFGYCHAGVPLVNRGTVAIRDAGLGTLRLASLPAELEPLAVLDAGGMGVVLVRADAGRARIFTVDTEGRFHAETTAPFDEASLLSAADGTLVLVGSTTPRRGVHALLRSPVELGNLGAWRDISVESAVSYLPVEGGRALVASDTSPLNDDLLLRLDEPQWRRVLAEVRVARAPEMSELDFDGAHLFVHPDQEAHWLAIAPDGHTEVSTSCLIGASCRDDD